MGISASVPAEEEILEEIEGTPTSERKESEEMPPIINLSSVASAMEDNSQPFIDDSLLSPEILEHIFKQLPLTDLKQARLACKKWNEEGCRVFRENSRVFFFNASQCKDFETSILLPSQELELPSAFQSVTLKLTYDIEDGMQCLEKILTPSGNYQIIVDHLYLLTSLVQAMTYPTTTLPNCLGNLRHLTLLGPALEHPLSFPPGGNSLHFPLLKSLGVNHNCRSREDCKCLDFITKIIDGAPNLTDFSFATSAGSGYENHEDYAAADVSLLRSLLCHKNFRPLKKLTIQDEKLLLASPQDCRSVIDSLLNLSRSSHLDQLQHLNLQLLLSMPGENVEATLEFLKFIYRVSPTLKFLNIIAVDGLNHEILGQTFPVCPQMETLLIPHFQGFSVDFWGRFPRLRSVEMWHYTPAVGPFLARNIFPTMSVERIGVKCMKQNEGKLGIMELCRHFPNARTWSMGVGVLMDYLDIMRCERERQLLGSQSLECLKIYNRVGSSDHMTKVLTGRNKSKLETSNVSPNTWRSYFFQPKQEPSYEGPSLKDIPDLKELHFLSRHEDAIENGFILSGLTRLGQLETVHYSQVTHPMNELLTQWWDL